MIRVLVMVSPVLSLGERTFWPASVLLPVRKASTSQRLAVLSLRSMNSTSFASIWTGTLNLSLVIVGLAGLTSVGDGWASSRTNRVGSDSSRGTFSANSLAGKRLKYGSPYDTKANTPAGENSYARTPSDTAATSSASATWEGRASASTASTSATRASRPTRMPLMV